MTARDLCWRAGGAALLGVAGAAGLASGSGGSVAAWGLLGFALAITGAVLLIQGRHVPLALRVERGRHRHLPGALRARHRRHRPTP